MSIDTQKPMVSADTQQLMDLCEAVGKGANERLPQLQAKLKERQQNLAQAWEAFGNMIESEPAEFTEPRKGVIEAVQGQYQTYGQALDKVGVFIEKRTDESLSEALTALQEASPMLRAAIMSFEMSILTAGPSKFPTVNLFDNMGRRLRDGELAVPNWRATCRGHQQLFATAIEEIDKSQVTIEPGIPERRLALTALVSVFQRLEGMGRETAVAEFEEQIQIMAKAHLELETAVNTWTFHTFSEKPTASPEANRVIHALKSVREGKLHPEVLKGLAANAQEHVKKSIEGLHRASSIPAESEVIAEEIPKIFEAMEAMDEALEVIKNAAEPWDGVDAAVAGLEAAVGRLSSANEVVTKANETYGKVSCPQCSALNPSTAKTCEKCNRQLPQFAGSDVYGAWSASSFQLAESGATGPRDFVVTRNMKLLGDACEAYEKGTMNQEDFLAHLKLHEEHVRKAEVTLSTVKGPDIEKATEEEREREGEMVAMAADAIGLLAQGVGACQAGLMKLERYAIDQQPADMREGLKEFFDGCQRLLQINLVAKAFVAAIPTLPDKPAKDGAEAAEGTEAESATPAAPVDGLASDVDIAAADDRTG